jgi:hypothetical protein
VEEKRRVEGDRDVFTVQAGSRAEPRMLSRDTVDRGAATPLHVLGMFMRSQGDVDIWFKERPVTAMGVTLKRSPSMIFPKVVSIYEA